MEFPPIYIETRDDSPVPEHRAPTSRYARARENRSSTPGRRASTPRASIETRDDSPVPEHRAPASRYARAGENRSSPGKRASTPRASALARPVRRNNTAVVFANDIDLGPLSPLTGMEDETEQEDEPEEDEDMLDVDHSDEGVEESLIPTMYR